MFEGFCPKADRGAIFGAQSGQARLLGFVSFADGFVCPQGDSQAPWVDAVVFILSFSLVTRLR